MITSQKGKNTIESIVMMLLRIYKSPRIYKVIEYGGNTTRRYLFGCWIDVSKDEAPEFLFGQFSLDTETSTIIWTSQQVDFIHWAEKARSRGWFESDDVRRRVIT